LSLVDQNPDEDLNPEEKQRFYEEARTPVKRLRNEILELRENLLFTDTESDEGNKMSKQLQDLNKKLQSAIQNASKDIFERVNSKGKNLLKVNGKEVFSVDLHGLHINEAKLIANEYILPVLEVARQIMVITGRGAHNQSGLSVLKNSMKEYFESLNLRCENVPKNNGALFVFGRF